ncbi:MULTISPECIES: hypothetical protein [unclassified Nostoc]|uniref:hypothetical protein n=1 Tax=unclassified Nostoc TaxID=2593658 RepID=UPI002AD4EC48|nr:hypothetical protein [Nostoc sp. DedQUE03]MDZ7977179.1 hypothetical protein [Nostoc sp. DedQUE03]MDZ8044033.1 hypothetical protein [Nostoc sp. DedQUE02]
MNNKTLAQLSFSAITVAVTAAVSAPTHAQLKPITVAESAPAPSDQRIRKTGFRLSNFDVGIATVCVETDRETQCTGRVPKGTSRVYTVRYHNLTGWKCHVRADRPLPPHSVHSHKFSRGEFKECLFIDNTIFGKRPNGSQKKIS